MSLPIKKPQVKQDSGNEVHVRVSSPTTARRELLSLAIDLIQIQKKHRDYMNKKREKEAAMRNLRRVTAEIKEYLRIIDSYDMPMSLAEIENLPEIKKAREALTKIERLRGEAEKRQAEEEAQLYREINSSPRPVPKGVMNRMEHAERKAVPRPSEPKVPVDKLEDDLAALKRRLDTI